MIYYWDKKLKKRLHVLEADIITIKKNNFDLMSLAQRMYFLQNMFQMTGIVLVTEISHYHINGLHLFWDTVYILALSFKLYGRTDLYANVGLLLCKHLSNVLERATAFGFAKKPRAFFAKAILINWSSDIYII